VDLNKLSTADKVIAASGILLFIAYFLPWFKADAGIVTVSATGGDVGFFWATLPMLLGLIAAGTVIATKLFDVKMPELPIPLGQALLVDGAIAAVLVVLKLIIGEDTDGAGVFGIEITRAFGLFLAAIAAVGLAAGGFLKYQEGEAGSASGGGSGSAPF